MKQNKLKGKKQKEVCTTLHYIEHLLVLASTVTGYIFLFLSFFSSLFGIAI